jgi:hypothetical protein
MLPLMVTYIQNNLSSEGMTWGFPNRESPDCGQWQHSPTMLLRYQLETTLNHEKPHKDRSLYFDENMSKLTKRK